MRNHPLSSRTRVVAVLVWLCATRAYAAPVVTDQAQVTYGSGVRARWVSIPGWLLSPLAEPNVPLSSYGLGAEIFRRKDNRDLSLSLTYQRMGPRDGNWLGRGGDVTEDTDLVQFRNFGIIGVDFSSIWRVPLHRQVSFRYGAGLGVVLITGQVLRVSDSGCTAQNVADTHACRPRYCPPLGDCPEAVHVMNQGRPDSGPNAPHRTPDPNIPGAFPVLSLLAGFDFRLPNVPGLELRVEGGFYDAFFLGIGGAWLFF
jgi:hypothetical protein